MLEPRLPQLPSLGELLEHPRVKRVVGRINRSTIALRATGFLEELRESLVERAGRFEAPSVGQLAERLARRLLGEPSTHGPVINATGLVVGSPTWAPPLAELAVQALVQSASEFSPRDVPLALLERDLCEATGAEAVLVVESFQGALGATIGALAGGRQLCVAGMRATSESMDWPGLAAQGGASLRSLCEPAAPTSRERSEFAGIVIRDPEASLADESLVDHVEQPPSQSAPSSAPTLAGLAGRKPPGACLVDVAPLAGLLNPRDLALPGIATIAQRLQVGADVVILDGSGLMGGPACGLICGATRFVEQIKSHPLAVACQLSALTAHALRATLAVWRDHPLADAQFHLPAWQLLSAPIDNLRQRADRLALLSGESPAVSSAEPVGVESAWAQCGDGRLTAPSWSVALEPATGDSGALLARLRRGPYPVHAQAADERVHLDLRSVFPRWDQHLIAALAAG